MPQHTQHIGGTFHHVRSRPVNALHPGITQEIYSVLGVDNSVRSRMSYGGTAPDQVRAQIARWRAALG